MNKAEENIKVMIVCNRCNECFSSEYEICPKCGAIYSGIFSSPTPKKQKKAKPVIIIISVILALLIVAGAGLFVYFKFFAKKEKPKEKQKVKSVDNTAYIAQEYGYDSYSSDTGNAKAEEAAEAMPQEDPTYSPEEAEAESRYIYEENY